MKQHTKLIAIVLMAASFGLMGCQGEMIPMGEISAPISSGDEKLDVDLGIDAVNEQTVLVEKSINETIFEIDRIANSGAFDFNLRSITSMLLGGMEDSLREVLDKMVSRLDLARDVVADARQRITERRALLNPNNPLHVEAIAKLTKLLERIDSLELKVDQAIDKVRKKANGLLVKIDSIIKKIKRNPILNFLLSFIFGNFQGGIVQILKVVFGGGLGI